MLTQGGTALVYDGDGNRVSEIVGSTTTKYLIDTLNPTKLAQVMDETVNGSVTQTYAYGLNRISENQLISGIWIPSFYGYDGHGNARFLANAAGTITDTYTYDAFGMPVASTGTTGNNFRYSGEWLDPNLGFYNLRARYYNPLTGRFETTDPYAGSIFDPSTLHRYLYAKGNPANLVDPSGKGVLDEALLIGEVFLRVTVPRTVISVGLAACPTIVVVQEITTGADALGIDIPEWLGGEFTNQLLDTAKEYCESYFPGDE